MQAAREREPDEAPAEAAPTAAAPAAIPSFAGPISPTRVMALQRLVGNAAVAGMLAEPAAPAAAAAPEAPQQAPPGAGPVDDVLGAGRPAEGEGLIEAAARAAAAPEATAEKAATPSGIGAAQGAAATPGGIGAAQGPAAATTGGAGAAVANGAAAGGAPAATGAAAAGPAQTTAAGGDGAPAAATDTAAVPKMDPHEDPAFQAMKGRAAASGEHAKAHQPAAAGASAAQAAAQPPGNEVASQAQGAQVEEMGKQQPGVFDKKAFVAAVKKAIDAAAPKNLEEADDFKDSGKAGQVKNEVGGLVKGGKKDAEKDIKQATDAPPDTSKATPKPVTPLSPEEPGAPPPPVSAASAMPGPRPQQDTDLSDGPNQVDQQMQEGGVTEEQLQKSNEPDFTAALDARQTAKDHAETAPAEYRAQEQQVLAKGQDEADVAAGAHLAGMHGAKLQALQKVAGHKAQTKSEDEAKRTKVANDIQAIYARTKGEVTTILDGLEGKVDAEFTKGEETARKQFEDYVGAKMDAYKDDRYSGLFGGARWLKDKLFGMPDEVNAFYTQGRDAYLTAMDTVIGRVADLVGEELNNARMKIAQGKAEVADYVAQLPTDLQKVGKDAEKKLDQQWSELASDVDNKQEGLVDTIAQKYVAARDSLDDRIEELKAANKGLVAKAIDAVVGVVKTIWRLKDLLLNVLAKAADVIGDIISDPIGFLGRLVDGVKSGLGRFVDNIAAHLEKGLMGWLFGALGDAGIELPKSFDLAGIFDVVMQVLGLTYKRIRAKVAKIVGEGVVAKMEETVDVFKILVSKGISGLWEWIKDKVGDFEELVLGGIKSFIVERVIKGGITWLLSLLNPAAAFIKACIAIYDIVMFIVDRGKEILDFVNAILDSIGAIARGNISVVADKVEDALGRALPLAISFLASLLRLGGITEKIKEGINAVRKPIEKAVDFIVLGAVKGFKKLFGGAIGWVKGSYEKGKAWATEKVEAGKAWAVGKAKGIKDRLTGKGPDDEKKDEDAEQDAVPAQDGEPEQLSSEQIRERAGAEAAKQIGDGVTDPDKVHTVIEGIRDKYGPLGLKEIGVVPVPNEPGKFGVEVAASERKRVFTFKAGDFMLERSVATALIAWLRYTDQPDSDAIELGRYDSNEQESEGEGSTKHHAEQVLLADLRKTWDKQLADLKPPPKRARKKALTLSIDLTRSPCDACGPQLEKFVDQMSAKGYDVKLDLRVAGLYKGNEDYVPVLDSLIAKGADINVLTAEEIVEELLSEKGERFNRKRLLRGKNAKLQMWLDALKAFHLELTGQGKRKGEKAFKK